MDDLALLNDYIASYTHRSLEYMEDKFVENEDLIGDAADTMWNRTLYTIASAVALRHKMEGPPHFCRQPKRYFEKVRGLPSDVSISLSRRVCTATGVYQHFNKIVQNLDKCQYIDRRTLKIRDLYDCQNLSRAMVLNDAKRPLSTQNSRDEDLQGYREDDFNDLLDLKWEL